MLTDSVRKSLARTIARRLFVGGTGERAVRLVMETPRRKLDGAGWCEKAAADQIEDFLRKAKL